MINKILLIGIGVIITVAVLVIGFSVAIPVMNTGITQIQCCNNSPCTDTYYTAKDNLCHYVLCEGSWDMMLGTNCTYPGANKSIGLTN